MNWLRHMPQKKKFSYIVFSIYLFFLVWLVLFKLSSPLELLFTQRGINLIPFNLSEDAGFSLQLKEILYNVFVFVPFGIYLCIIGKKLKFWQGALISLGLSLTFEIIQYILALGISDITDLITNTAGAMIGIGLHSLLFILLRNRTVTVINVLMLIFEVCFGGFFLLLTIMNL